jgi:hypothetical protein
VIQTYVQTAVGIAVVVYALYLLAQRVGLRWPPKAAGLPVDDVRIVSDLATRLRAAQKTDAVKIALALHAELLKPETNA